jgi:hypothetical protein
MPELRTIFFFNLRLYRALWRHVTGIIGVTRSRVICRVYSRVVRSAAMELAECAQRSQCGVGVELRSAAMAMERGVINVRRGACTLRNYYYSRTLPRIIAARLIYF